MKNYNSKYIYKLTHDVAVKMIQNYYESFSDISILSIEPLQDIFVVSKMILNCDQELITKSYISCNSMAYYLKQALNYFGYETDFVKVENKDNKIIYKAEITLVDTITRKRRY